MRKFKKTSIVVKFLNWLWYLDCKTKADRIKKDKDAVDLAVWQFNCFTR